MALPSKSEIRALVKAGREAVEFAQKVRAEHRRRRAEDRAQELVYAIERLEAAMRQVRPLVHSSVRREVPRESELREVSDAIQRERRKLRKMLNTTNRREGILTLDAGWS